MKRFLALFLLILAVLNITACNDKPIDSAQYSDIIGGPSEAVITSEAAIISPPNESKAEKDEGVKQGQYTEKPKTDKSTSSSSSTAPFDTKPAKEQLILEETSRHNDIISDLESKKSYTADYYDRQILPLEGYNTETALTQYITEQQKLEAKKAILEKELEEYKASTRPEDAIAAGMLKEDLADIDKQLKKLEILLEPYQEIIKLKEEKAAALDAIELEIEQENELHKKNLEGLK